MGDSANDEVYRARKGAHCFERSMLAGGWGGNQSNAELNRISRMDRERASLHRPGCVKATPASCPAGDCLSHNSSDSVIEELCKATKDKEAVQKVSLEKLGDLINISEWLDSKLTVARDSKDRVGRS